MAAKLTQLFSLFSNWRKVDAELAPTQRTQEICTEIFTVVRDSLPKNSGTDYVGVIGAAGKDLIAGNVRKVEVVCTFHDYTPSVIACGKKLNLLESALKGSDAPIKALTKKDTYVHFRFRGVEVEVYPAPIDVDWYGLPANQVVFALPTARLHQTLWFQKQPPECHALVRLALHWVNAVWGSSKSKPSSELIEHIAAYAISTLSPKNRSPKKAFQAFLEIGADVNQHIVLQDFFPEPLVPVIGHERIIMDVANPRHNLAGPLSNWKLWAQATEFTQTALKEADKFSGRPPASLGTWISPPSPDHVIYLTAIPASKGLTLVTKAFSNGAASVEVDGVGTAAEKVTQLLEGIDKFKFTAQSFRTHDIEGNPVRALLIRPKKQKKEKKEDGEKSDEVANEPEGEAKPRRSRRQRKNKETTKDAEAPAEGGKPDGDKPEGDQAQPKKTDGEPKPRRRRPQKEATADTQAEQKQPRQRARNTRNRKAAPAGVWRQKPEKKLDE
eukprot:TRINITY_DN795_c0_g1_i1.p1 TRINITY_DN795_c0_g1~~TRINITY_DN795_c0_g1_i1.p1  ORF type:complete len:507 (-),score=81.20 TRINITY_DN795_c0_g1_i1:143-1636(-)